MKKLIEKDYVEILKKMKYREIVGKGDGKFSAINRYNEKVEIDFNKSRRV